VSRLSASLGDEFNASIGTAYWNRTEDADALVRRADAAMYEQKRSGRPEERSLPVAR
jgi:PleD family two-component response regulator